MTAFIGTYSYFCLNDNSMLQNDLKLIRVKRVLKLTFKS